MKVNVNKIEETFFYALSAGAALVGCLLLFMILAEITIRALPSLTWYFITTPESMTPHIGMGIANAIWGSVIISLLATILSIPLALGTAIYLQKYATEGRLTRLLRFFIEVLSGTPAIVIGIFGLLVLVTYLRPFTGGFSLISGSVALAILIVPVIERSIENAISAVPFEIEEGSYALGATKWQTISMITLPTAVSGIITGAILGFGRAAEESAVVILTAGYSQFMPEFTIKPNVKLLFGIKIYPIQDLIGTLPNAVYHAYENSNVIKESNGFAAAVILISIVILVNFSAKIIITRSMSGREFEGGSGGGISTIIASIPARFRLVKIAQLAGVRCAEVPTIVQDYASDSISAQKTSAVTAKPTPFPALEQPAQYHEGGKQLQQDDCFEGPSKYRPAGAPSTDAGRPLTIAAEPDTAGTASDPVPVTADPGTVEPAHSQVPGQPKPYRYHSLQEHLGALFESRGGHPDADFSMAPITAALSEFADLNPVKPASTALTISHTVTSAKSYDQPSIMDGSTGVILVFAGMMGFIGLIYGIRFLIKDVSLELGSVILVVLLIAILLAVAAFQYMRLKLRGV